MRDFRREVASGAQSFLERNRSKTPTDEPQNEQFRDLARRYNRGYGYDVEGIIDPETVLKAAFISASDPIASKLAAARPQDIADVAAIRQAQEASPAKPARNSIPAIPGESARKL
jgi:hypothetical protein